MWSRAQEWESRKRTNLDMKFYVLMVIKKTVTAYLSKTLGLVNGYDYKSTKCIIKSIDMSQELSDYFREKIKHESQEICGVLGLRNASDLLYDVLPKDLGLIQPPFMPN